MKLFFCKWPDGDVSIVAAKSAVDASLVVDEIGTIDPAAVHEITEGGFFLTLRCTSTGKIELADEHGELTEELFDEWFPKRSESEE